MKTFEPEKIAENVRTRMMDGFKLRVGIHNKTGAVAIETHNAIESYTYAFSPQQALELAKLIEQTAHSALGHIVVAQGSSFNAKP